MKRFKALMGKQFSDDVLVDNEIKMNYTGCIYAGILSIAMLCFATLYDWSFYNLHINIYIGIYLIVALGVLYVVICCAKKGSSKWLKYYLVGLFILSTLFFSLFTSTGLVVITSVVPLAIACRYYSRKFTLITAASMMTLTNVAAITSAYFGLADTGDLNYIQILPGVSVTIKGSIYTSLKDIAHEVVDRGVYTKRLIVYEVIPGDIIFAIIVILCITIATRGKQMIEEQARISSNAAAMKYELATATAIQDNMLAEVFPVTDRYELYAMMKPAREVGGDFYDFFELDEDHVAIVIGDVSDKGVPSALFMAMGESIMHSYGELGYSPSQIFKETNRRLCNGNKEGMFITAFFGIVDLRTGEITYANAGHCAPVIKRTNGKAQFLKMQADLFLGTIENIDYADQHAQLHKGDKILLYTDGVTEAMNPKEELYGKERLLEFVNNNAHETIKESVDALVSNIKEFANGTEQNDDITMLLFEYKEV